MGYLLYTGRHFKWVLKSHLNTDIAVHKFGQVIWTHKKGYIGFVELVRHRHSKSYVLAREDLIIAMYTC